MELVRQLIDQHCGSGLLVDTNLLLLYLIGRTNKYRIPKFKRTQAYTIEDFDVLERFMAEFKKPDYDASRSHRTEQLGGPPWP